jgi:hypothetical protein
MACERVDGCRSDVKKDILHLMLAIHEIEPSIYMMPYENMQKDLQVILMSMVVQETPDFLQYAKVVEFGLVCLTANIKPAEEVDFSPVPLPLLRSTACY